jgi:hypothetical protein
MSDEYLLWNFRCENQFLMSLNFQEVEILPKYLLFYLHDHMMQYIEHYKYDASTQGDEIQNAQWPFDSLLLKHENYILSSI